MSGTQAEAAPQAGVATLEGGDFASLLQKEFKPRSDRAREAVESAVQTLAQTALAHTTIISNDALTQHHRHDRGHRPQADRAGQSDHARREFSTARVRVARIALPGQQHRDRRVSEDQGLQYLQEGSREKPEEVPRHGVGSEPDLQEGLRRGIWPVRRRAVRPSRRRLLFRSQPDGYAAAWGHRAGCRCRPRTVPCRHRADPVADGQLERACEPARSHQDLSDA